jgi:hypothetical protein
MRLALGRRNENDPDSSDPTLLQYLNDFVNLTMTDDLKLFEQFGTLKFVIDETVTDGVYTFNEVGASSDFSNISGTGYITLTDPPDNSISWNRLEIFQDPGQFFDLWGVDNSEILIPGYPTQMLYYGNEMTFRTIPNTSYTVYLYGYKIQPEFSSEGNPALPFDYWMRYLAYGAALNYARDYRYEDSTRAMLEKDFAHERKLLLTRTHNQRKISRCKPRF